MPPMAKKGEAICNNELVNFFENEKQKGCICSIVKNLLWGIDYAFLTKLNYIL